MQSPIKAVLFDMDDVLCAYHWRARVESLAQRAGRTFAAVDTAIWRSGFEDEADRGALSAAAYLTGFSERLGMPFSREDWIANRKAAMDPWPHMLALASELKAAGVKIGVLTNNGSLTADAIDQLYPALRPVFGEQIFVSATLRLAKPDPAIYQIACSRLDVSPSETFFTDDLVENVEGARRAGLSGCVFTGETALRAAMRRAGLPV